MFLMEKLRSVLFHTADPSNRVTGHLALLDSNSKKHLDFNPQIFTNTEHSFKMVSRNSHSIKVLSQVLT